MPYEKNSRSLVMGGKGCTHAESASSDRPNQVVLTPKRRSQKLRDGLGKFLSLPSSYVMRHPSGKSRISRLRQLLMKFRCEDISDTEHALTCGIVVYQSLVGFKYNANTQSLDSIMAAAHLLRNVVPFQECFCSGNSDHIRVQGAKVGFQMTRGFPILSQ